MACAEALPCASETDPKQAANCGLFFFCVLRLYHGTHPQRAQERLQRASADATGTGCGSMLCERLPSAQAAALHHNSRTDPQRAQMACTAALPCASAYTYPQERHTDRLSLYHGTHPTAGTQSLTASLTDPHRHNVPHPPSDSLSLYRWRENEKSNKKRILLLPLLLFCYYLYFSAYLICYISIYYSKFI